MATRRAGKDAPKPVFDRTPPQNIEAERSVLGAMLLNQDAISAAVELLHEDAHDTFYVPAHGKIYAAIVDLFRNNTPVDEITLIDRLAASGDLDAVGGMAFISDLSHAVPTSANIEFYAQIVRDAAVLRRIITICTQLVHDAYESQGEVSDLLDRTEAEIFKIAQQRITNPVVGISELIEGTVRKIEQIIETKSGITGLPTGFARLDTMLSGFQPSDMIILAARPSVGKTAFCLNIAANAAIHHDKSVLLFSLEMSKEQLALRLFCMEGRIDSGRLRTGYLAQHEFTKMKKAAGILDGKKIYIDDTPGLTPLDLRAKARRHKAQFGLDLLVIDYLQLMSGGGRFDNRQGEIAYISRMIKAVARELSIPVLALSQLTREADKDDVGSPKLSHLRESGAIEQDADVVLMLSRPPAHEAEGNENLINLHIAKQRNGPTGRCQMIFDRAIQRFGDFASYSDDDGPPPPPVDFDAPDASADAIYGDDEDEVPF